MMANTIPNQKILLAAIKAFMESNPDVSSFPAITSDNQPQWPASIGLKGKVVPINWDGTTITLAT